ncbi:pilus assembly protein TadG-related protein [Cupriavidus oxalaticus]|uniref:pilus assembly protein TadG-related protein n=1 Tax=Cupriavidus oxalaticus TaxID=96344 RepID=UPI003F73AC8D
MQPKLKKQKGAVAIKMAVMLVMLLSFAALAIDIGNLMVARNELQNAADAAALAAAPCIYPRAECGNATATAPDWATAEQRARDMVKLNKVQNVRVEVGDASSGYWDVGGVRGLQTPPITKTSSDLPAVRVVITKEANTNGVVQTFLAGIMGIASMSPAASATAVMSSPGNIGPQSLFPIALSSCLFSKYWDTPKEMPKLAPDNNPLPNSTTPQVKGEPFKFQIGSDYHYDICESGQWTTFKSTANDVPFVRKLVSRTNNDATDHLAVGEDPGTYIQPGTENSLYKYVHDCSAAGNKTCEWGIVPVVDTLVPKTKPVVVAFACVHILDADNGKLPYVLVQMSADQSKCTAKGSGGVGTDYGVLQPPRLVQ